MRGRTSFATLAAILALAACAGGPTEPARACIGGLVQAGGAIYHLAMTPVTAAEAGELYVVVQRERGCEDGGAMTVADSAYTPGQPEPWRDGDANSLPVGTRLYLRVGTEPGQELVAEHSSGTWLRFVRDGHR